MTTDTDRLTAAPAILRTSDGLIAGHASDVMLLDGRVLQMEVTLPGGEQVTQYYHAAEMKHLTLCQAGDLVRLAPASLRTLEWQGVRGDVPGHTDAWPLRFGPSPHIRAWERDHQQAYQQALRGPLFDKITVVESGQEGTLASPAVMDNTLPNTVHLATIGHPVTPAGERLHALKTQADAAAQYATERILAQQKETTNAE